MEEDLLQITAEESGERIDALLAHMLPQLSRSAAQRLLEEGRVLLRGAPVRKNYRCAAGDCFLLSLPEAEEVPLLPQDIPLDVVYEDGDVIVVNKPRGLVVHPAPGHPDGTLVNALLFHCGDSLSGIGGEKRPGSTRRWCGVLSGRMPARCRSPSAATLRTASAWRSSPGDAPR